MTVKDGETVSLTLMQPRERLVFTKNKQILLQRQKRSECHSVSTWPAYEVQ